MPILVFGYLRRYEHLHLLGHNAHKYTPPTCHFHLPVPFGPGTVQAFTRVSPPGIRLPLGEARLVSSGYYALG